MRTRLLSLASLLLSVLASRGLAQTARISVAPDSAPHQHQRRRPNASAERVVFTVQSLDSAVWVQFQCEARGNIEQIVECPAARVVSPAAGAVDFPVTFSTGAPGSGEVRVLATPTNAAGVPTGPGRGGVIIFEVTTGPIFQVSPSNVGAPDPTIRLANTSGHTVNYDVSNIGETDSRGHFTCTTTGSITITSCPTNRMIGSGGFPVTVSVTFSTGNAGTGTVMLLATPVDAQGNTDPNGQAAQGQWNETFVNPAVSVTPDLSTVLFGPNTTGASQVFAVTNTGTASTNFSLTSVCPFSGFTSCSTPSTTGTLAANASTNITVTFNTGAAGSSGTIQLKALYNGTEWDTGSITAVVPNAAIPDGPAEVVTPSQTGLSSSFSLQNTGPAAATFTLSIPTCTGMLNCGFTAATPRPTTTTQFVSNGGTVPVLVYFDSPATGTGTIALRASFGGATLDDGAISYTLASSATVIASGGSSLQVAPSGAASQVFTVTNTGPAATFTMSGTCPTATPVSATGCSITSGGSLTLAASGQSGSSGSTTVSFTGGSTQGAQGPITVEAKVGTLVAGSGQVTITIPKANVPDLTAGTAFTAQSGLSTVFTVQNQGPVTSTFDFTVACSGSVNGCSVTSGSSASVGAGSQTSVTIGYGTGSTPGSGTITLSARFGGAGGTVLDTGAQSITVSAAPVPMVLDVASMNPDSILPRGQCLALRLGSAVASECGDLRIVHPLPAVRTMNSGRAPVLIYSSAHAYPWVNVLANLTLPGNGEVPTTVSANLFIGGVQRATGSWGGSQWTAGSTRRISLGFNAATQGLATGIYTYTLEVTNSFASSSPAASSITGKLVVVDRRTSYFGAGWWLAGLEKLDLATMIWYGGGGSVKKYNLRAGSVAPNRVWGAPSITYPDSIREISGSQYVRQLPDSVWVTFDATGKHIKTRNRLGHLTTFAYDAQGRLQTLTVPTPGTGLIYTFAYDANNHLQTVTAPGDPSARVVTITADAATGKVTSILDPGTPTRTISFGYGTDYRITSRTNGRGAVTSFLYDVTAKVSQSSLAMGGSNIVMSVLNVAFQGTNGNAVDPAGVKAVLSGPRSVNVTSFTLNRYGAPTYILDAKNQPTTLTRGLANYPGLVTYLLSVTGLWTTATYDSLGRIRTSTQPSTTGANAVTTYEWDPKWDALTKITAPEGNYTRFGVDPVNGNRLWQEDARGSSARTTYGYNSANQVIAVTLPGTNPRDLLYDALGNLYQSWTALDFVTTYTNNAIGLTTNVATPTGTGSPPGGSPYVNEAISYSARNEDLTHTTTSSDATNTVTKSYDAEGNLSGVTRSFTPNPQNIASATTTWVYDNANRPTTQTEPDGSYETRTYDEAGNLTSLRTRRAIVLGMGYDELNRMTSRSLPAVSYSGLPASQIFPGTNATTQAYTYSRPAETQSFGYSPDGQIASAVGLDATVGRSYFGNGLLSFESLQIKKADRSAFGGSTYTLTYAYDKNGRRTSLALGPSSLFTGAAMTYGYDGQTGLLSAVTDIAGNSYGLGYTVRNELLTISYPGSVTESYGYDGDSRMVSDGITRTGSTAFPYFPGTSLRGFTVTTRDAAGKIRASSDPAGFFQDQVQGSYSGMGYALTSSMTQKGLDSWNQSATFTSNDTYSYDGLGNTLTGTEGWGYAGQVASSRAVTNTYTSLGRINTHFENITCTGCSPNSGTTAYAYDAAGNSEFESYVNGSSVTTNERRSFFGADDKIMAVDRRTPGKRMLEEYRFDALGRRVWVRQRTQCEPLNDISCVNAFARRTVWDGNQELAEVQAPYDTVTASIQEADQGWAVRAYNAAAGSYGDPNPYYGRVVYGPALGTDQPVSMTRYDYRDYPSGANTLTWPRYTISIFWNYRGSPVYGLVSDGKYNLPYQLGGGQTNCPILGDQSTQRCVLLTWPDAQAAFNRNRGYVIVRSWQGTMLEEKRDGSGLQYMRNRSYDPSTGRFSQEDVIGLAGGLNTYGFAGGDPINFSDPMGDTVKTSGREAEAGLAEAMKDSTFRRLHDEMNASTSVFLVLSTQDAFKVDFDQDALGAKDPGWTGKYWWISHNSIEPPFDRINTSGLTGLAAINFKTTRGSGVAVLKHELAHLYGIITRGRPYDQHSDPIFRKFPCPGC